MGHMRHIRLLAAHILLCVFLTSLVCVATHVHHKPTDALPECHECAMHLQHPKHLSPDDASDHFCPVCHLLTGNLFSPATAIELTYTSSASVLLAQDCPMAYSRNENATLPRGPPAYSAPKK